MGSFTENARYWAQSSVFDQATRQEVRKLLEQQDEKNWQTGFPAPSNLELQECGALWQPE